MSIFAHIFVLPREAQISISRVHGSVLLQREKMEKKIMPLAPVFHEKESSLKPNNMRYNFEALEVKNPTVKTIHNLNACF